MRSLFMMAYVSLALVSFNAYAKSDGECKGYAHDEKGNLVCVDGGGAPDPGQEDSCVEDLAAVLAFSKEFKLPSEVYPTIDRIVGSGVDACEKLPVVKGLIRVLGTSVAAGGDSDNSADLKAAVKSARALKSELKKARKALRSKRIQTCYR